MYASYCPAVDAGNKAEEAFEKAKNKLKAERKAILELEMEGGAAQVWQSVLLGRAHSAANRANATGTDGTQESPGIPL